jgi:hypothetical protein
MPFLVEWEMLGGKAGVLAGISGEIARPSAVE